MSAFSDLFKSIFLGAADLLSQARLSDPSSYGMTVFKADGSKIFSTSDSTWNYVGHFIAPANQQISKTFPSLALATEITFQRSFVGNPPDNQEAIIHKVAPLSGNQIHASGGSVSTLVVVLAR